MAISTLVCLLSETRANELTWDSFKRNVLDTLNADLALCISTPDGYDFSNNLWQNAKYKWVSPEYDDFSDGFELARKTDFPESTCNWRRLLEIKDQWLGGIKDAHNQHGGSAGILEYFRWFLWKNIRDEKILEQYDRIIVTRSDFIWLCPHPPLDLLDETKVWIPRGEFHGGVTDRHAVLSRHNVGAYLNIIKPMLADTDNLYNRMNYQNCWNLERYIKMRLDEDVGVGNTHFFPYIMYAVRAEGGSTRWSPGDWDNELGYSVKYRAELHAAREFAKIIKTPESWINFRTLLGPNT